MRKISIIHICLLTILLAFASFQAVSPANALFFKIDAGKTTSKITNFFKTQKAKCEKIIEDIQSSQFGQFIGDGIKNTKAAIAFAQSTIKKGMDFYNKTKQEVVGSAAYKSAMVSKKIATKGIELKKLEEEKLLKLEEVNQEKELLQTQTSAKIANIQNNLLILEAEKVKEKAKAEGTIAEETTESILEDTAEETTEEETLTAEQAEVKLQIEALEQELQEGLSALETEYNTIVEEYKVEEKALAEEIAELTKELAQIVESAASSGKKKKEKNTNEMLNAAYGSLAIVGVASISVADEIKIKKARKKQEQENNVEAFKVVASERDNISTAESEVKSIARTAKSQPGESETAGVNTQTIVIQMKTIRSMITLMIADLKTQTSTAIGNLTKVQLPAPSQKFNLCNYTDSSNVYIKSLGDSIMEMKEKAEEKIGQAQEIYQDVKSGVESAVDGAKSVADGAKSAVEGAKEKINDATGGIDSDKINTLGM